MADAARAPNHAGSTASRSLVDADPDLVQGIPQADLALARRALTRPVRSVPAGTFTLPAPETNGDSFGVLVIGGAFVRELELDGRRCGDIVGPGDVIASRPSLGVLEVPVTWTALEPAEVIDLDHRFALAAQRWPRLAMNVHRRLLEQAHRSAVHAAIAQLPRVDRRLLALLWQLSERWGHVTPEGVEVRLDLTHEALGRLVGAQRPTVTLALADLAREGAVSRTFHRTWLLNPDSLSKLSVPHAGEARRPLALAHRARRAG